MDSYSTIVLIGAAILLLSTLIMVRRRNQKHQAELLARDQEFKDVQQIELMRVQNPTDEDLKAYDRIEAERQKVWKSLSLDTSIAPRKIYQLSFDLINTIAGIYHPEAENPVFQASIFDLLQLNYRIIERVKGYLDEFPLNTIKDMNIHDILRYKDFYDKLNDFQLVKIAKDHKYLYTIGKYAWMGYNALNPWYWGRRVAFTAGKEGALRYLLTVIITVVGEESVLVYSRRNLRTKAVAVEKQIAFEMINMALSDGEVSQKEYEILLDFILTNPRFDDSIKVTLLKAMSRKRPIKTDSPEHLFDAKEKRRLLAEVERVAKADNLGLLKKREALKALENSLVITSDYRARLEATSSEDVQARDVKQQNRRREQALLCLMAQAGSVGSTLPATLRDYLIQRAAGYPLPFSEQEQAAILREALTPTPADTLTDLIRSKADKERTLSEVLEALLWEYPFSQEKEQFYNLIVAALDLKKAGEAILQKGLRHKLPAGPLIETPTHELLKALYRLLEPEEHITGLQNTGTKYRFTSARGARKHKDSECWLCVTSQRVLVLAATTFEGTLYHHHETFGPDVRVRITPGKLFDTYLLQEGEHEVRLENALFRSSQLKRLLQPYIQPERQALEHP